MSFNPTNLPICLQKFSVSYANALGDVMYSNVCLYPTSIPRARSWNFVQQVVLTPTDTKSYTFTYDFTNVVFPPEYVITFEGPAQGTATIGNATQILNLQRHLTYDYDFATRTVVFHLELPCELTRQVYCLLNIFISDRL